ncbi:peptidylprolyl isomerase [Halorhodospira abdelmalekii]|uniref:FKBP-type peptidyl-prolyl cis-trans isomerase n=1 Tax=Halorhodospira abdelmalekii TaxID=421629 RepID=UPI001908ADEC|nr:peptidylprolyl isomerase [Halorhodospira abdelmalekii]MBK1734607.1 peptidylprolyl isomerase [Halorhodospira abdelmalekii]
MQVGKQKVVTFDYTLTESQGEVLDQSQGGEFSYLHGSGNIIPGLEQALEGKEAGDELSVTLEPADAYGERDDRLVQNVPKDMFPGEVEVTVGSQFQAQGPDGTPIPLVVTGVGEQEVEVDANHPLAGETLNFEVKIVEVREATEQEVADGQVRA